MFWAAGLLGTLAWALVVASTDVPARTARPFDAAPWLNDYTQLTTAIEERYANLAWKASPDGGVDLPALSRAASAALRSATSDADAARAIRAFVSGFRDGHFSELPPLRSSVAEPANESPVPGLDRGDPATGCGALGFVSTGAAGFSLPFETLPGFKLLDDGLDSPFRTGVIRRAAAPTIGIVRIQNFRARPFPAVCLQAWGDLVRNGAELTAGSVRAASRERWFADLAKRLQTLQGDGVQAVLIDIGNNSGGDDSGDWAARLFSSKTVHSARMLMVDAPVSSGYFDEEITDLDRGVAEARTESQKNVLKAARDRFAALKSNIGQAGCDMSWVWRERRLQSEIPCNRMLDAGYAGGPMAGLAPGDFGDVKVASLLSWASTEQQHFGVWTRRTFVLTDGRTDSSAEMFTAVMKDNGLATIIGSKTGGDGCGFMVDAPPLILSNSKLRFRIPNCVRLRADGTNEELGITPDVALEPTDGESARARAERAIRIVSGSL